MIRQVRVARRIGSALAGVVALVLLVGGGEMIAAAPATATPVTSHPRLWITKADLPRLRSWAVPTNPMFKNGLQAAAVAGLNHANACWDWNAGTPASCWKDSGSSNWEGDDTEAYAEMFAFMSLVDPAPANRSLWASRARTLLMYAMNQAAAGPPASGVPFRDPGFATYNRANYWGEAWGLIVDWIYPSLSKADKATIRSVFLRWGNQLLVAATAGNEHPQPVGVLNDLQLLGNSPAQTTPYARQQAQLQLRWAANNYFLGHMRNMTLMALSFDAADDQGGAPTPIGGSLHSLVDDAIGAWLYQAYAVFEDPALSKTKLGITGTNQTLGAANGGVPVEGAMYGESLGYLLQALLGLRTAGYTDPATYGPQIDLINSSFWDQAVAGFLHSLTPQAKTPTDRNFQYLGPVYGLSGYGDVLRSWITGDRIDLFGTLAVGDLSTGNKDRAATSRWIIQNVLEGGSAALYSRAANIWGNSYASYSILYFLVYDPGVTTVNVDPRLALSPQFIAPATGRIMARNNWTPQQSWFTFRCGWETINHIHGDCGQFEFYRNGQWLAKEWSGYDNDRMGGLPTYHNALSIQNAKPASVPSLWQTAVDFGGQWDNGGNNGDPSLWLSVNDNWSYARADATNLYNHPSPWTKANQAMDVKQAVRSIVWLAPDHVVVYDRAATGAAGRFKRFNLTLVGKPAISGTTAVSLSGNQQLTVTSLLPKTAQLAEQHNWTTDPTTEYNLVSMLEPSRYRLVIADGAAKVPANDAFLTVLQGTNKGTAADTPSHVVSGAGTPYEGAAVANTVVLFPIGSKAFQSLSYAVPDTVTRHLITGLVPGAGYTVNTNSANGTTTVTITKGGSAKADVAGIVGYGFAASSHPTQGGRWSGATVVPPPGS